MEEQGAQHNAVDRELNSELREPAEAWKAGILYFNPRDRRIWVPRRRGLQYGQTLNLGNPRSWIVLALLLLPTFLVTCVALWATRLD